MSAAVSLLLNTEIPADAAGCSLPFLIYTREGGGEGGREKGLGSSSSPCAGNQLQHPRYRTVHIVSTRPIGFTFPMRLSSTFNWFNLVGDESGTVLYLRDAWVGR